MMTPNALFIAYYMYKGVFIKRSFIAMPESKATGQKKWLGSHHLRSTETHPHAHPGNLSLAGPASEQQSTQPLFSSEQQRKGQPNTPSWVRPFLSLRTQLTLTYSLLLVLLVAFTYLLLDR